MRPLTRGTSTFARIIVINNNNIVEQRDQCHSHIIFGITLTKKSKRDEIFSEQKAMRHKTEEQNVEIKKREREREKGEIDYRENPSIRNQGGFGAESLYL